MPGRVYRTHELSRWGRNPSRLARRLEREGKLYLLAHGLFVCPRRGKFGVVPPDDNELLRAFLEGTPFVMTGPERWNELGLGTTASFATRLVYNTKRSGLFQLGGRQFLLRRVAFPDPPTPEWFAVDLIQHHEMAGISLDTVEEPLRRAIGEQRLGTETLRKAARHYGTQATQALVERAIEKA